MRRNVFGADDVDLKLPPNAKLEALTWIATFCVAQIAYMIHVCKVGPKTSYSLGEITHMSGRK